jgi:uncharacterized protein
VPHVDVAQLPSLLETIPSARLVLLNAFRGVRGKAIDNLATTKQIYFDIAWLEGIAGIRRISSQIPMERLVFGSYAPFFYFESSLLKLKESPLTDAQLESVQGKNAGALIR